MGARTGGSEYANAIAGETRAESFGTELKLLESPDTHTHYVTLSATEAKKFADGEYPDGADFVSTLADGHEHKVKIRYDSARSSSPWYMAWCSSNADSPKSSCREQSPPGCGFQADNPSWGNDCCNDETCPDGHAGLEERI